MKVQIQAKHYCGTALLRGGYYGDGTLAIEGVNPETQELLFVATVRMPELPAKGCVWLNGWSENEGIPEALEAAGIVELTGRTQEAGHCHAVEARLLKEID